MLRTRSLDCLPSRLAPICSTCCFQPYARKQLSVAFKSFGPHEEGHRGKDRTKKKRETLDACPCCTLEVTVVICVLRFWIEPWRHGVDLSDKSCRAGGWLKGWCNAMYVGGGGGGSAYTCGYWADRERYLWVPSGYLEPWLDRYEAQQSWLVPRCFDMRLNERQTGIRDDVTRLHAV